MATIGTLQRTMSMSWACVIGLEGVMALIAIVPTLWDSTVEIASSTPVVQQQQQLHSDSSSSTIGSVKCVSAEHVMMRYRCTGTVIAVLMCSSSLLPPWGYCELTNIGANTSASFQWSVPVAVDVLAATMPISVQQPRKLCYER
jgi:hypothetical protein